VNCLSIILLVLSVLFSTVQGNDPAFKMYRWSEDYRYLEERDCLSAYDRLKYKPMGEQSYLSFGGTLLLGEH
jgi:hypothetical protein